MSSEDREKEIQQDSRINQRPTIFQYMKTLSIQT